MIPLKDKIPFLLMENKKKALAFLILLGIIIYFDYHKCKINKQNKRFLLFYKIERITKK